MTPQPRRRSQTRVLHVLPVVVKQNTMGGCARVALDLIKSMESQSDIEFQLCVLGDRTPEVLDYGWVCEPAFIHAPAFRRLPAVARSVGELRGVISKCGPTIVHSHLWQADMLTAAALPSRQALHISQIHDTRPWVAAPDASARIRRSLLRLLFRKARTRFVACSDAACQYACEHMPLRKELTCVIRNGIDTSRFPVRCADKSTVDEKITIGMAGRLQPEKGADILLAAGAELVSQGVPIQMTFAGGGDTIEEYGGKAEQLGLSELCTFAGRVADMPAFYRELDIFVLPSIGSEGLPLTILEAMATGLPVVGTNHAGIPEVIDHGVDGLLVPVGDAKALAEAIKRLCDDSVMRQRLGAAAATKVRQEFSIEHMASAMLDFYSALMAEGRHE